MAICVITGIGRKRPNKEREDLYVEKGYDAEKIKEMRNDEYTQGIVDELQNEIQLCRCQQLVSVQKRIW